jgi:hypothetical protein
MSSYRIGQPIKDSVADVIRERQELLKTRRNGGANEFYSEYALSFFNSKTPWVRLSSAVDINDYAKAEYFDVEQGDQLARENVLQGTSKLDQGFLDYYKGGERLQGTFDRQQLGLRPKPGITNVSTTSHGMFGALRTTEITVQCWTPFDLDIIDSLYMRPGYSVLLEMGHTHYLDSNFALQDDIVLVDFFKYGPNESEKLLSDIQQKREAYRGSYEALYGVIKNFSWTLRPDGGYECKIKLVSKGEVLESLITTGITDKVDLGTTEGTTPLDNILNRIERVADEKRDPSKSVWLDLEEPTFKSLVSQPDFDKYSELKGIYSYRVLADKTKKSSFETHITLGLFNAIVNGLIIIENETTTYTKVHSQLDSNQFKTVSGHYSINPRICLLPKDGVTVGGVDFKLEKNPYTPTEIDYGNGINSILISTSMIRAAIRNSLDTEENTVSVVALYRYIFNAIQNNTGNINSFSLHLDEKTNTWHIVDRLFINTQEPPVELSILGLDSFAKGIMLQSMLSPKISSMLAISAQASQNPNSTLDSTAFSTLNRGLEDRLVPVREYPKKINSKTEVDADKLVEDTAYLKDYITSIYFNNVGQARKYSIANNVDRIAPIYRDKLNRVIQSTPKNGISFAIPFELTLTLDGIGGLAIGESFTISSELLPLSYKRLIETESTYKVDTSNSQIGFLITGLNQQVNETSWDTVVRCQMYVLNGTQIPTVDTLDIETSLVSGVDVTDSFTGSTPNADRLRSVLSELGYVERGREISEAGDITVETADMSIAIFKQIKNLYPSLSIELTSGNDLEHVGISNTYTSRHESGRGIDFIIKPATEVNINRIEKVLQGFSAGNSNVRYLNEYTNPTRKATGKHFHISWGQGSEGSGNLALARARAKEGQIDIYNIA